VVESLIFRDVDWFRLDCVGPVLSGRIGPNTQGVSNELTQQINSYTCCHTCWRILLFSTHNPHLTPHHQPCATCHFPHAIYHWIDVVENLVVMLSSIGPWADSDCWEWVVLVRCLGNPQAVWVLPRKTVWFGCRTVRKPDPLLLREENLAAYPSTRVFTPVQLDPPGPISCCAFRVVLCLVAFRYCTVNRRISTKVRRAFFGWTGRLWYLNRWRNTPSPILDMSVNGASTIPGLASWVSRAGIGCSWP